MVRSCWCARRTPRAGAAGGRPGVTDGLEQIDPAIGDDFEETDDIPDEFPIAPVAAGADEDVEKCSYMYEFANVDPL